MTSPLQQKIKITGPSVVTANRTWDGVVIYRTAQRGWSASLSDAALDELLAHELAHLAVCAETGRSDGHGDGWWRRYHALVDLT